MSVLRESQGHGLEAALPRYHLNTALDQLWNVAPWVRVLIKAIQDSLAKMCGFPSFSIPSWKHLCQVN